MPHQCVKCGTMFNDNGTVFNEKGAISDNNSALTKTSLKNLVCLNCGARFFFFVKKESIKKAQELTSQLTVEEKQQIEKDVLGIMGDDYEEDQPVILDLESIRILKPGKYEIDLVDLFKGKPLVYKLDEGKYVIDIASTFDSKDLDIKDEDELVEEAPEENHEDKEEAQ